MVQLSFLKSYGDQTSDSGLPINVNQVFVRTRLQLLSTSLKCVQSHKKMATVSDILKNTLQDFTSRDTGQTFHDDANSTITYAQDLCSTCLNKFPHVIISW